jgi:hypothetical protein
MDAQFNVVERANGGYYNANMVPGTYIIAPDAKSGFVTPASQTLLVLASGFSDSRLIYMPVGHPQIQQLSTNHTIESGKNVMHGIEMMSSQSIDLKKLVYDVRQQGACVIGSFRLFDGTDHQVEVPVGAARFGDYTRVTVDFSSGNGSYISTLDAHAFVMTYIASNVSAGCYVSSDLVSMVWQNGIDGVLYEYDIDTSTRAVLGTVTSVQSL